MDNIPAVTPPGVLLASLAQSEAQIEAGEIVPMEPVLDRLRASIARMKACFGTWFVMAGLDPAVSAGPVRNRLAA